MMSRKVVRADRSPMNAERWCLELECGHEVWITSRGKPKHRSVVCTKCAGRAPAGGPTP